MSETIKWARNVATVGLMLSAVLVFAACSGREASGNGESTRPRLYRSVEELSADSDVVVIARATGQHRDESINDLQLRVANLEVLNVVSPKIDVGTDVWVKQEDATTDGVDARLAPGQTYLLFLQRFEFERGKPYGTDYVVVGGTTGLFVLDEPEALNSSRIHNLEAGKRRRPFPDYVCRTQSRSSRRPEPVRRM